jgi:hypothetical protein
MPNIMRARTSGAIYWVKKDSVIIIIFHLVERQKVWVSALNIAGNLMLGVMALPLATGS